MMKGRARSHASVVLTIVVVVFVVAAVSISLGVDPPHWSGVSTQIDCTSQCHVPHHAGGGGLTQAAGNVNLCQSCHNAGDLPIFNADSAIPRTGGTSHAFDACAVNADLDTQLPTDPEMNVRVMDGDVGCVDGYVVCSTCHDQHAGTSTFGGTTRVGNADKIASYGGTGIVVAGGTYTGAAGSWYLVEITQAGTEGNARFRYSKDNGTSWFPSGCTFADTNPCLVADGSNPVALGVDGVAITFNVGSYQIDTDIGERWEFFGAWPFMRSTLGEGGSSLCAQCHQSWVMDHNAVEIWDGGSYKSHPVGVPLNTNGKGYDRATPLDGNGAVQGGAGEDANPTNDLLLFNGPSDLVECLTCHGVHYVDSNTETVDGP